MASDTRNRILSVAARLFEAQGFEGTAVASILREADVNSGSLYHFFPSKDALLVAVLEKYVDTLEPALLGAADRAAQDPVDKVFALLELYRGRLLVSGFSRGCPVGDLSVEVGGRIPEAGPPIRSYFERWTDRVEGWLSEAGGRWSAGVDHRAMAEHILSTLQGGLMQSRAVGTIGPFDRSVEQLRLIVDLLSNAESGGVRVQRRGAKPRVEGTRAAGAAAGRDPDSAPASAGPAEKEDPDSVAAGDAAWWRAW